jgi:hypothetical protein
LTILPFVRDSTVITARFSASSRTSAKVKGGEVVFRALVETDIGRTDLVPVRHDHGAPNPVLELPHVAGPRIRFDGSHGILAQRHRAAPLLGGKPLHERMREQAASPAGREAAVFRR